MKARKKTGGSSRSGRASARKSNVDPFNMQDDRRSRYLAGVTIDFKNKDLLGKFMTEQGKIIPRRITGATSKQQRRIRRAITQARIIGLVR